MGHPTKAAVVAPSMPERCSRARVRFRRAEDGAPLTRSAPFRPKKDDDGRLRRDDFDACCGQLIQSKLQNLTNTTKMSFGLYLLGFSFVIIGVAYGAYMMGIPTQWIVVVVLALVGLGIMKGVSRTRMRDQS